MNNQGNMTPLKEVNKTPMTHSEETEIYELPDKVFRIILLKEFGELQEHR